MFWEDEKTGLPKKLSRKEQQAKKDAEAEKKRKTKPQTGKKTSLEPNHRQATGMTLKDPDIKGKEAET